MDSSYSYYSNQYEKPRTVGLDLPSNYYSLSFSKIEYKDISQDLGIPPIPKLEYPNIHYRCPKCFNFPLIEFINRNEEIIRYSCACHAKKVIKIEDLFKKEKNYMSFIDTNSLISNNESDPKKDEVIGFKCIEHKNKENNKFEYYCLSCHKNLCKYCIKKHLYDRDDLMVFDFQNFEADKKINEILNFENEKEKEKESEEENTSQINISKIAEFIEDTENNKKANDTKVLDISKNVCKSVPKNEKEKIHKNFINLINTIINDYLNYPNYLHFVNIENIYRVLIKDNLNKKEVMHKDYDPFIKLIYIFNKQVNNYRYRIFDKFEYIHRELSGKICPLDLKVKFLYNGCELDINKTINEIITESDKERKTMVIIVKEITVIDEIKIKEVKCPECNENIFINFDSYKMNLRDCSNGHNKYKILISDFMTTQKSNNFDPYLYCSICFKSSRYQNSFYECFSCKKHLCQLCKEKHDKFHQIVDYKEKNYICNEHNGIFQNYCIQCNKNICLSCEKDHKNHDYINLKDNIPDKKFTFNKMDNFRKNIDNLKYLIKTTINKFNMVIQNLDIYYKIYEELIKSFYDMKYKNYQVIDNILEFEKYTDKIIEDINKFFGAIDDGEKFRYLINIYEQMCNNNSIIGEIYIDKENINKEIRIINSLDQRGREGELINKFDSPYRNEEEIKNYCNITIDNNPIGFSYFYKFNKIGKYNIKYTFMKNLSKANDLFANCSCITKLDFTNFSSEYVINMDSMFFGCKGLKEINLLNFNTEKVISMRNLFSGCESLKEINVSYFNTGKVTDMSFLFFGCKSLTKVDLGNFDINNVEDLSLMFYDCDSLSYIHLPYYKTKDIAYVNDMYNKLKKGKSVNKLIEAIFKLKDYINSIKDLIE